MIELLNEFILNKYLLIDYHILRSAIVREYEDQPDVHMEVHSPANNEEIVLNFRGEKMAKV